MTDEEIERAVSELSEVHLFASSERLGVVNLCKRIRDEIRARTMATIAEKDAKIYAYESIIANSNFKAVVIRAKTRGSEK